MVRHSFALVALVRPHRYAGVQAESADIARRVCLRRVTGGQCLQRQHLAPGLRPYGDAPGDGVTPKRVHRRLVDELTGQVAVPGIALQQSLPFKISANALCDALRQFAQLGARGRVDPAQTNCAGGMLYVHPIEKQHVKVQVHVKLHIKCSD